ncbi:hypothetical protein KHP62_16430 [Rhodobacteraceae bacterium NNCM2]|nr:hypothetical protein [Coraliihabitans acroporae]
MATAALDSFDLILNQVWPIEFYLEVPLIAHGQAGAGVKIGCVRYEAFGAMFDGKVNPLTIAFKFSFDYSRRMLFFNSRVHEIKAKNFSFRTFPRMEFPLSEVVDYVLARVSESLVVSQATKILRKTRIPIADFSILEETGELINNFAGTSDPDENVTVGVSVFV